MEQHRFPRKILERGQVGRISIGRPRKRWIEDVEQDLRNMGTGRWRKLCNERAEQRKIVEGAKTNTGL